MEDQYQETLDAALTPSFRLFSRASVLWATFLGTPFPGGVLMALNYSRMGMNEEVARVLRWTGAFTACVIGLSIVWPASWNLPSALMVAPQLALMGWFYSANQKGKLQAHLDSGGRKASLVAATGVGLCSALIIVGGFLGADELLWMKHGKVLGLPLTDQVYYKDGATIEHARATAMVLRDQYWFPWHAGAGPRPRR